MKKVLYERVRHIRYISEVLIIYSDIDSREYPMYHTTYDFAKKRIDEVIATEISNDAPSLITKLSIKIQESRTPDFSISSGLTLYEARLEIQGSK